MITYLNFDRLSNVTTVLTVSKCMSKFTEFKEAKHKFAKHPQAKKSDCDDGTEMN